MTSKTHAILGLTTGLLTLKYYPNPDIYTTISGACIGSLIPDLDTRKSDPSQIFPWFACAVDRFSVHRGITHTTLPFIFIILYFWIKSYACLVIGLGALSHTLIDEFTRLIGVKCGSRGEEIIYKGCLVLNALLIIKINGFDIRIDNILGG